MRKVLFHATAGFFGFLIGVVAKVSEKLLAFLGVSGYALMRLIDSKRLAGYQALLEGTEEEQVNELTAQQTELNLLSTAAALRDHAKEVGGWTPEHEEALNAIGEALLNQLYWDDEAVHQYMKEIVESIDGYEYGDLLE